MSIVRSSFAMEHGTGATSLDDYAERLLRAVETFRSDTIRKYQLWATYMSHPGFESIQAKHLKALASIDDYAEAVRALCQMSNDEKKAMFALIQATYSKRAARSSDRDAPVVEAPPVC